MRAGRAAPAALGLLLLASCATVPVAPPGGGPAPPTDPDEVRSALLARNAGIGEVRAVVEARISFAGTDASFPGVLLLRRFGGFRLDLLDVLDRPLAIVFAQAGRIVQYRPAEDFAASLGTMPEGCSGIDPGEWAVAVLGDAAPLPPGDRARVRSFWGTTTLEIKRRGELRQSVRYTADGGDLLPERVTWYCDGDPVMRLGLSSWTGEAGRRLPGRFTIAWPRANLSVKVEVREVETGQGPVPAPLVPRLGAGTRWTVWKLPR